MASFSNAKEELRVVNSSDIPAYLRNSAFFTSLSDDNTDTLTVTAACLKQDETVDSISDAVHLLNTYRFWGVTEVSTPLIAFILSGVDKDSDADLLEFQDQLTYLPFLIDLRSTDSPLRMERAAAFGSIPTMRYLKSQGLEPTAASALAAAGNGHLACLMLVNEWGVPASIQVCAEAALRGKLDCLQFALRFWKTFDQRAWSSGEVTDKAVHGGHADCLRAAHKKGCPINAHVDVVAASKGFLSCLEYIDSERLLWTGVRTPAAAAGAGHLDCLRFLHTHECDWDHTTIEDAAAEGHLPCIMYAVENGCPRSAGACSYAAGGHLPCLQYLHQQGFVIKSGASVFAAAVGALDCLIYVHEHGCEFDEYLLERAADRGHLSCLQYMHAHGCPMGTTACFSAARSGHLACLQFLHEVGCPWDYLTLYCAADGRHPDCLQYALDNGCPVGDQSVEHLLAWAKRS